MTNDLIIHEIISIADNVYINCKIATFINSQESFSSKRKNEKDWLIFIHSNDTIYSIWLVN